MMDYEKRHLLLNFGIFLNKRDIMLANYETGDRKSMTDNIDEFLNKEQDDG